MPTAELQLAAHPSNVGSARRFLRETLAGWGCEDLVLSAELVVSELVSNSILHARSPVQLRLQLDDSGLLVEVGDESSSQPVRRHYANDATTGRGLGLIAALTDDDWGSRATADGKVVWARIPAEDSSGGRRRDGSDAVDADAGAASRRFGSRSTGTTNGASALAA